MTRAGGPAEYGLHGFVTLVANCYLLAGLGFLVHMGTRHRVGTALPVARQISRA